MTKTINNKQYEVVDTLLAGNLTMAHLGVDMALMYIKKYRYAGKDKEKTTTFWNLCIVAHSTTNGTPQTRVTASDGSSWLKTFNLSPVEEVILLREVAP